MSDLLNRFEIIKEFLYFLWQRKLWWLIPMMLVVFTIGILILLVGSSPLAPIIYPLF